MDVDALAREALARFERGDFDWPLFPKHVRLYATMIAARFGTDEQVGDELAQPPVEHLERLAERHIGDLRAFYYRGEPGAAGFLIVLRGEDIAYVAAMGGIFFIPRQVDEPADFADSQLGQQLVSYATMMAYDGIYLDFQGMGWSQTHDEPLSMWIGVSLERYAALTNAQRDSSIRKTVDVMRDYVRLVKNSEHPATLSIRAEPPAAPPGAEQSFVVTGSDREVLAVIPVFEQR